jgi:hypothetical protein
MYRGAGVAGLRVEALQYLEALLVHLGEAVGH